MRRAKKDASEASIFPNLDTHCFKSAKKVQKVILKGFSDCLNFRAKKYFFSMKIQICIYFFSAKIQNWKETKMNFLDKKLSFRIVCTFTYDKYGEFLIWSRRNSDGHRLDIGIGITQVNLPPPLLTGPGCKTASVFVGINGQIRAVVPQGCRLKGRFSQGYVFTYQKIND